jgi:hypothetical protein
MDFTPTPENKLRWSREEKNTYSPSLRYRLLWWFGLLSLAMIASYPDPRAIFAFYLFPFGLMKPFWPDGDQYASYLPLAIVLSYGFYLVHLVLFLSLSAKKYFYILLWIFIFALALNTVGCHTILAGVRNIH